MRVMDHLLRSIRNAALFKPEVQAAPHCILWPECDRPWEPTVQRLLPEMPELFILGEYNPEKRTGSAIYSDVLSTGIFYAQGVKANVIFFDRSNMAVSP